MGNGLTEAEELELLELEAEAAKASIPSHAMQAMAGPNQGIPQAAPGKSVDEVVGGKSFLGAFADTLNPVNAFKGAVKMGSDVIETPMDFLPIPSVMDGKPTILKPLALREFLEADGFHDKLDTIDPMDRLFDRFVEDVPEEQKESKKRELITNALLGLTVPGGPLVKAGASIVGGEAENQIEQAIGTAPDTPFAQDAGEFAGAMTVAGLSNALINRVGSKMGRTRMEVGRRADKFRAITDRDQLRADALSTTQKDFTTRINRQTGEKYNTINDIVGEVDDIFEVRSQGESGPMRENVWTEVHKNLTEAKDVAYRTTESILDNLDIPDGHKIKVRDLGLDDLARAGEEGLTGASSEAASRVANRELLQLSKKLEGQVEVPIKIKLKGKVKTIHETHPKRQAFQDLHSKKFRYESPTQSTNIGERLSPAEETLYQKLRNDVLDVELEPAEVRSVRGDFDSRGKFRDGIAVSETENAGAYRDLAAKARSLESDMVEVYGKGESFSDYQAAKKRYSILAELDEDVMKLDIESRRKFRDGVSTKRDINAGAGEDFKIGPANMSKMGRAISGETNFSYDFNDPEVLLNMSNDAMGFERPVKQGAAAQRRAGYFDAVAPVYEDVMKQGSAPAALGVIGANEGNVRPAPPLGDFIDTSTEGISNFVHSIMGPSEAQAQTPPPRKPFPRNLEVIRENPDSFLMKVQELSAGQPGQMELLADAQVAVSEQSDMLARKAIGALGKSLRGLFEPSQHQSMIDGVITDPAEKERFREELIQKYDRGEIDSSFLAKQVSELNSTGRVIFKQEVRTPSRKAHKKGESSNLEKLSNKFKDTPIGERREYSY